MGIDAHMVVRNIKREIVNDETLKLWSWKLCQSIGAKDFFISDGLPPKEYRIAYDAWNKAFEAHECYPEFRRSNDAATRTSLRERIIADVGEHPELRCMAIQRVGETYWEEGEPEPGTHYSDDGPVELRAKADEILLSVSLWGRYYGPGYERGDVLKYCAIAEWLEQNIHGCEVWYGGDSSGVELKLFDEKYRSELRRHLFSQEGRDYFNYGFGNATCRPKPCSLCPGGEYLGSQFGSGANYAAFHCAGCGKSVETRDHGKTWTKKKED